MSDLFADHYGAILLDQPHTRTTNVVIEEREWFASKYKAKSAEVQDRRFLVLTISKEREILDDAGYTWEALNREGRYVTFRQVVCVCGASFAVRELTMAPERRNIGRCYLAFIPAFMIGMWLEGFWLALVIAFCIALFMDLIHMEVGERTFRRKFRERASTIDGPFRCPECGSADYGDLSCHRKVRCPQCGEMAMRFKLLVAIRR